MSTEELKIYLYHVYQLEKQKYMIESTYASLQKEIKQAKYVIEQNRNIELADDSMHVSKSSYLQMYVMGMLIGGYFIGGIGYFIDILTTKMDGLNGFIEKVLSILFIVLWPMGELVTGPSFSQWIKSWNGILLTGVFLIITVGVIVLYILERNSTREENIQNKKYNEEIIISSKQKIYEKEKYITTVLVPECDYLKNVYMKTKFLLQGLYSIGIIGEKYRKLVPVASFCEYLEYGRCDSLTGTYGAYNKFEDELYKKIVIGKLDDIQKKMDEIKNTQIMMYHVMEDSKKSTIKLLSDMKQQNYTNHQDVMKQIEQLNYNVSCIEMNKKTEKYLNSIQN